MSPLLALLLLGLATVPPPPECVEVQGTVDRLAAGDASGLLALRLAPFLSGPGLNPFLEGLHSQDSARIRRAIPVVSRSRQASGLRALKDMSPPKEPDVRLEWSLALLALGDPAATGTVASFLSSSDVGRRRRAASALSKMRHKRPRLLLQPYLDDPDPELRLSAAKAWVPYSARRARRALREILERESPELKVRAARALLRERIRLAPDELALLPVTFRARALMSAAGRGRAAAKELRETLVGAEPELRLAAVAALLVVKAETPASIRRLRKSVGPKLADELSAPLILAEAILGSAEARSSVASFSEPDLVKAVAVLAHASRPERRFAELEATRYAVELLSSWLEGGRLPPASRSTGLVALSRFDADAAVRVARAMSTARVDGAERAIFRILGRHGNPSDARVLIDLARQSARKPDAGAWMAAARVCRR